MIEVAKAGHRMAFEVLWWNYLCETFRQGADVIPDDKAVQFFLGLFDAYADKSLDGVAILDLSHGGVLLWGESPDRSFNYRDGPVAQGWGTFVVEQHRGKGVSVAMREIAGRILSEMGFRRVIGATLDVSEAANAAVQKAGFTYQARTVSLELEEAT